MKKILQFSQKAIERIREKVKYKLKIGKIIHCMDLYCSWVKVQNFQNPELEKLKF